MDDKDECQYNLDQWDHECSLWEIFPAHRRKLVCQHLNLLVKSDKGEKAQDFQQVKNVIVYGKVNAILERKKPNYT